MAIDKSLFGKVFISHASLDKPFVRRLVDAIEADGFQTWLDEKELLPGDPLARRLSEGVAQAPAVLVVVSQASIVSKWLTFELNKATDRMVQGACRVIPIVIEKVPLPPEVVGLLYSDFSESFDLPLKAVLRALNHDASLQAWKHSFQSRAELLLEEVFDGTGFSFTHEEYKSRDLSLVFVDVPTGQDQTSIAYEIVPAHYDPSRPLSDRWIEEYELEVGSASEQLFIVLSERLVAARLVRDQQDDPRLGTKLLGRSSYPYGFIVVVDCSSVKHKDDFRDLLLAAKALLARHAATLRASGEAS